MTDRLLARCGAGLRWPRAWPSNTAPATARRPGAPGPRDVVEAVVVRVAEPQDDRAAQDRAAVFQHDPKCSNRRWFRNSAHQEDCDEPGLGCRGQQAIPGLPASSATGDGDMSVALATQQAHAPQRAPPGPETPHRSHSPISRAGESGCPPSRYRAAQPPVLPYLEHARTPTATDRKQPTARGCDSP